MEHCRFKFHATNSARCIPALYTNWTAQTTQYIDTLRSTINNERLKMNKIKKQLRMDLITNFNSFLKFLLIHLYLIGAVYQKRKLIFTNTTNTTNTTKYSVQLQRDKEKKKKKNKKVSMRYNLDFKRILESFIYKSTVSASSSETHRSQRNLLKIEELGC